MSALGGKAEMLRTCFDVRVWTHNGHVRREKGARNVGLARPNALLARPTVSMSRSASGHSLGRGRIDYRAYPRDAVGRKAAFLCMRPHRRLIGRDIDAIDLVIGHKALD